MAVARKIASRAPLVIRVLKEELRELTAGTPLSAETFERLQATREVAWRSRDLEEGIKAFFEKRSPTFTGK